MPTTSTALALALLAGVALAVIAAIALRRRGEPSATKPAARAAATTGAAAAATGPDIDIPFDDEATARIANALYQVAFGSFIPEPGVLGEHAAVVKAVGESMGSAIADRQYFPRKPMVIPQLLKAVRSNEGAVKELVEIIMKDPVLTGDVLKMANSAYYRTSGEAVDTLGRAVVLLGTDGLRSLVSASLLQPVFRAPKGCFDRFSDTIWTRAFTSALAAQTYARRTRSCDSFTAHLTALLSAIGWIVLFRLIVDKYLQMPTLRPRPDVFIALLEEKADGLSKTIAQNWELAESITAAIDENMKKLPVNHMTPLARSVYFGRLCASCALLVQEEKLDPQEARSIARQKGLAEKDFDAMWQSIVPEGAGGAERPAA